MRLDRIILRGCRLSLGADSVVNDTRRGDGLLPGGGRVVFGVEAVVVTGDVACEAERVVKLTLLGDVVDPEF